MNRPTICRAAAIAAALALVATGASAQDIHVRLNGQRVYFEGTRPMMVNGRVLVPLRGVLEQMGANVDWIPTTQTVVATRRGTQIELPIGSHTATVNGREVTLDQPAVTIGGSTMVPLRFVSESIGADVGWSDATQTVMIDTRGAGGAAYRNRDNIDQSQGDYRDQRQRDYRDQQRRDNGDQNQSPRRQSYYRDSRRAVIAAGTVIPVRLEDSLTSNDNQAGDPFRATVDNSQADTGLPDGTRFEGVVDEAIPAHNGRPGLLTLRFQRVVFPDGDTQPIDARVTSLDSKYVQRDSSGRFVARGGSSNNETLKWVGIGAGAGLLLSTITKGNTLLDTLLGGGAGYLYNQLQNKGAHNVRLGAGTEFGAHLTRDFAYYPTRT